MLQRLPRNWRQSVRKKVKPKKQPEGKETAQWQINSLKALEEAESLPDDARDAAITNAKATKKTEQNKERQKKKRKKDKEKEKNGDKKQKDNKKEEE